MATDIREILARDITTGKWSRLLLMKVPYRLAVTENTALLYNLDKINHKTSAV
jgi:hypothetical protein